jgi:putative sterol carrier protein
MATLFPGAEWVEQLKNEINRSDAYASAARTWEGDFYFIVKPGPGIPEPVKFYLDLWHGQCRDAHIVANAESGKPEFVIAGTLDTYRQIFTKKLDPIEALMKRKLDIHGNMLKVMRSVKATVELVNCCTLVDTEYPDAAGA